MLRNRSRAVATSNKQQQPPPPPPPLSSLLMSDHYHHHQYHPYTCLLSPNNKTIPSTPISSFLPAASLSPRFFSPTSILDTNNSPYPFGVGALSKSQRQQQPHDEQRATGLAMIDSMLKEDDDKCLKPVNRMALFGSKLKVEIPGAGGGDVIDQQASSPPKSPGDFGMKTTRNGNNNQTTPVSVRRELFSRQLSLKEMEMSEDYTCVITHGPIPKTTHIYDDCIVECCCDDADLVEFKKNNTSDDERAL